ncbi:Ig-like domain-containing protein [Streptomyces sp. XD-27]|uniref:L,D-transpeptidase n=1 Tax=Streptomyces sp. XD-27 TaxID=3062779 RepID=UPI0026F47446|nr:Ig-like domain-containing protein [Streptomyces sp. XD-27]WKX72716.1 Ig-like domain-containing protein [Streptomyces sp. XD-27]
MDKGSNWGTYVRAGRRAIAVAAVAVALAGCSLTRFGSDDAPRPPAEVVRVTPHDGARGIPPGGRLTVTVPDGRLEQVRVTRTDQTGTTEPVAGRMTVDGRAWRPTGPRLALAARYAVNAVAVDERGRRFARHTTFTTVVPPHRFIGYFTPEDGATVGTGTIVSFTFNRPITNRAAVERAIRVTSRPRTDVAAHWFGNRRLDFRPSAYWTPGTEVTLDLRLRDVRGARGVYGIQHKKVRFTVGRSQVSTVDTAAHTMTVRRNGAVLAVLPVTAGAPGHETYNGKMVVMEKLAETRMDGSTVGFGGEYDISDVPHAMRLTSSGTFVHGNYWAKADTFGAANASHGCIGLRDVRGGSPQTAAGWFYHRSLIGDVVEVVNSRERQVAPDNGLGGWNMPWAAWRAGSALDDRP